MVVSVSLPFFLSLSLSLYIYIYRDKEREREREIPKHISVKVTHILTAMMTTWLSRKYCPCTPSYIGSIYVFYDWTSFVYGWKWFRKNQFIRFLRNHWYIVCNLMCCMIMNTKQKQGTIICYLTQEKCCNIQWLRFSHLDKACFYVQNIIFGIIITVINAFSPAMNKGTACLTSKNQC